MPKPWENAEGYHDPTAYHGTKNIIRDEDEQQKRVNTLIFVLKYITRLASGCPYNPGDFHAMGLYRPCFL